MAYPTNIKELRKLTQNQTEPITYLPARLISIYITRWLMGTAITPNAVTFLWMICLLGAAAAFSVGRYIFLILGGLLILLSYVLDCTDGELARLTSRTSKIGTQLEQMVHWVTNGLLLLAITFGIYWRSGIIAIWAIGALAIIGDYTFHFLYNQLHLAANRKLDYGFLHTFTRWLYNLMPINTNLMVIGAFSNQLLPILIIWTALSNLAWMLVFSLYYRVEVEHLNKK